MLFQNLNQQNQNNQKQGGTSLFGKGSLFSNVEIKLEGNMFGNTNKGPNLTPKQDPVSAQKKEFQKAKDVPQLDKQSLLQRLKAKKQQILEALTEIQKSGEKIQLKSKLTQLESYRYEGINQNKKQQLAQIQTKINKLQQQIQSHKKQLQTDQSHKINHLNMIFDNKKSQKDENNLKNQSKQRKSPTKLAKNIMESIVMKLRQNHLCEYLNSGSENQIYQIYDELKKEEGKYQQLQNNYQNLFPSPNQIYSSFAENSHKSIQNKGQNFIKLSKQKSNISKNSHLEQSRTNEKINEKHLQKLKRQNREKMKKLLSENSIFTSKQFVSKISQGRNSMIMKSIIIE